MSVKLLKWCELLAKDKKIWDAPNTLREYHLIQILVATRSIIEGDVYGKALDELITKYEAALGGKLN